MERESFVFHKEWMDAISGLPDEMRLEIYEAIIEYGTSGKSSDLKPMARLAFNFVKSRIDKDAERLDALSQKRTDAVNSRWERQRQTDTNVYKCIQDDTNAYKTIQNDTKHTNVFCIDQKELPLSPPLEETPPAPPKEDYPPIIPQEKNSPICTGASVQERSRDFMETIRPYVATYGRDMCNDFFAYWTEPNKSGTKMRFELERTWEIRRRLQTWARRNNNFNANRNGNTYRTGGQPEERLAGAASIIARLAAEDDAEVRR